MAYDEFPGCEPLRVWGRLETRSRRVDFDGALQARVHDPLWFLTRQWQFGEFKGEDTGSPVLARIARRLAPVTGLRLGQADFKPVDDAVPVQARAESLPIDWRSPTRRAALGRHFIALLDACACELPSTAAPYVGAAYRSLFAELFRIEAPPTDAVLPGDVLAMAQRRAESRAQRVLGALAGRAVDGHALALSIPPDATWTDLPSRLTSRVVADHLEIVLAALRGFRRWFYSLHVEPAAGSSSAWAAEQVEYQFECALPRDGKTMVLSVDGHGAGGLDWQAFDQAALSPAPSSGATTDVKTVILSPAEFAGMPNSRWWQFEDAAVDLGSMRADATDLAKVMVAEFALLFGNNWFVVPYRQPIGTLAEIEGIVVTDVFGWRTLVRPSTGGSDGLWSRWDVFSLAARSSAAGHAALGQHLWLAPSVIRAVRGDPFESVAFVRDEMANMVWAVETRVPDGNGGSQDGSARARRLRSALAELSAQAIPSAPPAAADGAVLKYTVGSTVPENWIPFLPVHKPDSTRSIRLQRASMPRFLGEAVTAVRPLSSVLRAGLRDDDSQQAAFYVHEEEIPPAGLRVEAAMYRARWFGGKTVLWHARSVSAGRGEGGSGLRFDTVHAVPPP